VRPVPSDNAADFVIDDSYDLEAFLDFAGGSIHAPPG